MAQRGNGKRKKEGKEVEEEEGKRRKKREEEGGRRRKKREEEGGRRYGHDMEIEAKVLGMFEKENK